MTVQRYQPRAEYLDTGKDHDNPPTCYSPSNSILFVQTHTSLRKCPPQLGHFGRPLWVVSRFPQGYTPSWQSKFTSSDLLKDHTSEKCYFRWGNSFNLLANVSRLELGPKNCSESRNLRFRNWKDTYRSILFGMTWIFFNGSLPCFL